MKIIHNISLFLLLSFVSVSLGYCFETPTELFGTNSIYTNGRSTHCTDPFTTVSIAPSTWNTNISFESNTVYYFESWTYSFPSTLAMNNNCSAIIGEGNVNFLYDSINNSSAMLQMYANNLIVKWVNFDSTYVPMKSAFKIIALSKSIQDVSIVSNVFSNNIDLWVWVLPIAPDTISNLLLLNNTFDTQSTWYDITGVSGAYVGGNGGTTGVVDPTTIVVDITPNDFNFTNQTWVATGTAISSDPVVVWWFDTELAYTVVGWTMNGTTSGVIHSGDSLTLIVQSSDVYDTTTSVSLTIGWIITRTFSVTTMTEPTTNNDTNDDINDDTDDDTTNTPSSSSSSNRSSGGWGSPRLTKDNCPSGDNSPSYYDGTCEGEGQEEEIVVAESEDVDEKKQEDVPTTGDDQQIDQDADIDTEISNQAPNQEKQKMETGIHDTYNAIEWEDVVGLTENKLFDKYPIFQKLHFIDMDTHQYKDSAYYLARRWVVRWVGNDGTKTEVLFAPDRELTRMEALKILVNYIRIYQKESVLVDWENLSINIPPYQDVNKEDRYYPYVQYAYQHNLLPTNRIQKKWDGSLLSVDKKMWLDEIIWLLWIFSQKYNIISNSQKSLLKNVFERQYGTTIDRWEFAEFIKNVAAQKN